MTRADVAMLVVAIVYAAFIRLQIPAAVKEGRAASRSWWPFRRKKKKNVGAESSADRELPPIRVVLDANVPKPAAEVRRVLRRATLLRIVSAVIYATGGVAAAVILTFSEQDLRSPSFDVEKAFRANALPVLLLGLWVAIPSRFWRGLAATSICVTAVLSVPRPDFVAYAPLIALLFFVSRSFTTLVPLSFAGFMTGKFTYTSLAERFTGDTLGHILLIAGCAVAGGIVIFLIGKMYEWKWFSDVTFSVAFLWLLFGALALRERPGDEWLAVAMALLAYGVTIFPFFKVIRTRIERRDPARLLVLRVFDTRGRARRLFNEIGSRWRFIGPVQTMAGTDSAVTNLDVGEAARFLLFLHDTVYIRNESDARERLSFVDVEPDRDGRYRINDFFCTDDVWQEVFLGLLNEAHAVVVDLCGYKGLRAGIDFELAELFARKRLSACVFLTDSSTNEQLLVSTLGRIWSRLPKSSPNYGQHVPSVKLLKNRSPREVMPAIVTAAIAGGWNPGEEKAPQVATLSAAVKVR